MAIAMHPGSRGFTMIELMMTLVVLAVLLGLAVPSFNQLRINAQTSTLTNDLTGAINLARAEAVKRAEAVTVCPSENGTGCTGAWTDGWIVAVIAGTEVVRRWPAPTPAAAVTQTPDANDAITFGELGQRVTDATNLEIQIDGCQGDTRARRITIGGAGRTSVERIPCT